MPDDDRTDAPSEPAPPRAASPTSGDGGGRSGPVARGQAGARTIAVRAARAWRWALAWPRLLYVNLDRSRTLGLATEMAFWLFLSLLPLAAVLGLVVAKLATKHQSAVAPIFDPMPSATRELVTRELSRVSAWNGGAVAPFAAAVFVWFASGGVHAVFDSLELETESKPRPWWKKRVLAIATCVVLSIGVAGLTLLGTGLDWVRTLAGQRVYDFQIGASSAFDLALRLGRGTALLILLHCGIYWVGLPSATRRRMPLWPGAVLAVVLEGLMGYGYGSYLSKMGTQSAYQASLSIVAITMITLWLFAVALLAGAELNQQIGLRRVVRCSVHRPKSPPPGVTPEMIACEGRVAGSPSHRPRSRASRPLGPSAV
jgi:membrane protein